GRQCFFDGGVEFGLVVVAQVALDDAPLLVDQEGAGRELDVAEGACDFTADVQGHREGQLARFGEIEHVVGRVVAHGHGHGFVALGRVRVVGVDVVGHLLDAGDAARGPELHQHDLAPQVVHAELPAVDGGKGHIGGGGGGAPYEPGPDAGRHQDGQGKNEFFHLLD